MIKIGLDKCVDQTKRNDVAEWDEKGNLITITA